MLSREIIQSCSNEKVASAALASIGGFFAARVEAIADNAGMESGALAARAVRYFGEKAGAAEWDDLRCALVGQDLPVLTGLRHILEFSLPQLDASSAGQSSVKKEKGRSAVGGDPVCCGAQ